MANGSTVGKPIKYITGVGGFPAKGTLPTALTLTGTFSSTGDIVTGVGTLFEKEIVQGGMWLFSTTLNEIRKVKCVQSATLLELEEAFSAPVAGDAVKVTCPRYQSVSAKSSGGVAASYKGLTFPAGEIDTDTSDSMEPVVYDATAGEITFSLLQ